MPKKSRKTSRPQRSAKSKPSRSAAASKRQPRLKRAVPRGTGHAASLAHGQIELIARGVLLRDSRVLLCQNLKHGYFYLPGGHVEFGESAAAAVEREFLEETGQCVRAGALLLIDEGAFATSKARHHELNLVFHVEQQGSTDRPIVSQEKHIGFVWLELAAVTEADIRPLAAKAFLAAGPQSSPVAGRGGEGGAAASRGAEWVSAIPR